MEPMFARTPRHCLVIDFEATCADDGAIPRDRMEIIEIGAVMVDWATLRALDEFQCFVRPVRYPRLTAFCTGLTGIVQADVDAAPGFAEAAAAMAAWLRGYPDRAWCSWGDYDRKQLQQDCRFHGVGSPMDAPHFNLKPLFAQRQGLSRAPGLAQAVRLAGLSFQGNHHRGIDDARNIARLLPFALGPAPSPP